MNKSMEGPDLGSDESPRSSVNSHEWQNLMENSQDGTKNREFLNIFVNRKFEFHQIICIHAIQSPIFVSLCSSLFPIFSTDLPRSRLHGTTANSCR